MEIKADNLEEFQNCVKSCQNCFGHAGKTEVFGMGDPRSKIMLVVYTPYPGEGPDPYSVLVGAKHVKLYDTLISALGLQKGRMWTTSCCKCFSGTKIGSQSECKKLLLREIELVNPSLIIISGERAYRVLMGDKVWVAGKEEKLGNRKIVSVISPESVARNPEFESYFQRTIKLAKKSMLQPSLDWYV